MGRRVVEGKKDADKDRAELITELNALRDFNSRLKDVVKRYEKVAGKKTYTAACTIWSPRKRV